MCYFSGEEDECMNKVSKRMKIGIQNHNNILRCQMPDLIRDACDFDEIRVGNMCNSSFSSTQLQE